MPAVMSSMPASSLTTLVNCISYLSHDSAIQIVGGASYTTISNAEIYDNADATTTGNNVYGILSPPERSTLIRQRHRRRCPHYSLLSRTL